MTGNPKTKWPEGVSDGLLLPCGVCSEHPVLIDYTVTDEVWSQVPVPLRCSVVCLDCLVHMLGPEVVIPGLVRIQVATQWVTRDFRPVATYQREPE